MTRTEAQVKGLYYPTPEPVVEAVAQYLAAQPGNGEIRFLDPCVGKGRALRSFVDAFLNRIRDQWSRYSVSLPRVTSYGIEPNIARVKDARSCVDEVLHASYFQTLISNGDSPDGGFQIAFVNPPYDYDKELFRKSGKKERLEITFLQRTTKKLCPYGVLVWVVPQGQLARAARHLCQWYHTITVRRFPDDLFATPEMLEKGDPAKPMFEMFKQVVVIARRRAFSVAPDKREVERLEMLGITSELSLIEPLQLRGKDATIPSYNVPAAQEPLRYWLSSSFDPEEAARQLAITYDPSAIYHLTQFVHEATAMRPTMGVYSKQDYWAQRWPTALARHLSMGRPLAPLKKGHISIMAVAGIVNGAELEGKDGRIVIVKGYSKKRIVTLVKEDDEAVTTEKKDSFETALWCIEMTPGEKKGKLICVETGAASTVFNIPCEKMSLQKFLDNFGVALTQRIAESNPALYSGPHQVPWAKAAFAQMKRQPLGRQRDFILSIVNAIAVGGDDWARMDRAGEIAEMATGKTYLSLATVQLGDLYLNGFIEQFPRRYIGRGSRRRLLRPRHFTPVLVMCPEIIAYKWKREAEITLPNVKAVVVQRIDTRDKAEEFRMFDPSWRGKHLSAAGCMERAIVRIKAELSHWQQQYDEAKKGGLPLPKKSCHIVILPNNVAKLGMTWTPIYRLRPVRTANEEGKIGVQHDELTGQPMLVPCCPSCFAPIKDQARIDKVAKSSSEYQQRLKQLERKKAKAGESLAAYEDDLGEISAAYVSEDELWGGGETRRKRWCGGCGGPLWQYMTDAQTWSLQSALRGDTPVPLPLPGSLSNLPPCIRDTHGRRVSIADYVRKYHSGFFKLLIADEIHQGADGTALDFARRSLMGACDAYLGLTGTLCNGYSSSLFPFVWSINPGVRSRFAYNDTTRWVDRYGARKTTVKEYKDDEKTGNGAMSKRRTGGKPVESEMAAFSPDGLPEVFTKCAFLELIDVAPNLPPYKERVDIVPMGDLLGGAYRKFESTITQALAQMLVRGDKRGLSSWFQALRGYPNMPHLGRVCEVKKTGEVLGVAPKLPESIIFPKEQRMIDLVQEELEQDRRVIIYVEDTGEYDVQPRYQSLLEAHVKPRNGNKVKVAVLRANGAGAPSTMKREEWLHNVVDNGCNVLICNSALVQVGLDLIDFHTILVPSIPTSTSQMRQAYRRIHRPGQKKNTKVIILVYGTMECRLLKLMAKKMQTSLMVEGKLPGQGLVSFGANDDDDGDFVLVLAREVLAGIEKNEGAIPDAMDDAEELQQMFREAQELEQQQNEYVGLEEDPEEEKQELPMLEPITTEELSSSSEDEPLPPVTLVPVAITGDPWAAWLKKRDAYVRPRKKRFVVSEAKGSLWGEELPPVVVPDYARQEPKKKEGKKRASASDDSSEPKEAKPKRKSGKKRAGVQVPDQPASSNIDSPTS